MDFSAEREVQSELRSGERLLWSGRPRSGLLLSPGDALLIPFSLLWAGFAVFWEYSVIRSGAPILFSLWGVPFVAVGAYMVVGRFIWDAYRRSRTYYGLTDRRIVIVSGAWGRKINSLSLSGLTDINLSERQDRTGTISLGPSAGVYSLLAGSGWPGAARYVPPRLEHVSRAREVHDRILRAQEAWREGGMARQRHGV